MSRTIRGRWLFTAAALAAAGALGLAGTSAAALPPGDPGDPGGGTNPQVQCLLNTRVNSSTVDQHTTFGVSTVRYSWNVTKGCTNLQLSVAGHPVAAVGSMQVSVPTSRYLTVHGSFPSSSNSGEFARQFVIAGRFVKYSGASLTAATVASSGNARFDLTADRVIGSVKQPYASRFNAKVVQIHLIPSDRKLTDLPLWSDLDPNAKTDNPADGDRTWGEVRGIAHRQNGSTGIAVAVGAEQHPQTVAHELGHIVLRIGAPEFVDDANTIAAAQLLAILLGGDNVKVVGCDDAYSLSTVDEYWAEGTAALFDTQKPCSAPPVFSTDYTPAFLRSYNRPLYDLLRRVYNAG